MSPRADEEKDTPIELTVLVIGGWILPLAGYVWGPGEWWQYAIWLVVGTALIALWVKLHPGVIDFTPRDEGPSDDPR